MINSMKLVVKYMYLINKVLHICTSEWRIILIQIFPVSDRSNNRQPPSSVVYLIGV